MRLIDADDLREEWLHNGLNEKVYDTNDFLDSIDDAPTIEAAPVVHAHWIEREFPLGKNYECSNCQHIDGKHTAFRGHYCWYCGAKMDEIVV